MNNYLISEAIGDITGSAYEGRAHRIKDYNKVKMFSSRAHFTDDTVLTFACAEAFIDHLDMTMNLWKCANEHRHAGFGSKFKLWMASHNPQPYRSLGNGSPLAQVLLAQPSSAFWSQKITLTASNLPYLSEAMQTPLLPLQALWPMPITKRCLMPSSIRH